MFLQQILKNLKNIKPSIKEEINKIQKNNSIHIINEVDNTSINKNNEEINNTTKNEINSDLLNFKNNLSSRLTQVKKLIDENDNDNTTHHTNDNNLQDEITAKISETRTNLFKSMGDLYKDNINSPINNIDEAVIKSEVLFDDNNQNKENDKTSIIDLIEDKKINPKKSSIIDKKDLLNKIGKVKSKTKLIKSIFGKCQYLKTHKEFAFRNKNISDNILIFGMNNLTFDNPNIEKKWEFEVKGYIYNVLKENNFFVNIIKEPDELGYIVFLDQERKISLINLISEYHKNFVSEFDVNQQFDYSFLNKIKEIQNYQFDDNHSSAKKMTI